MFLWVLTAMLYCSEYEPSDVSLAFSHFDQASNTYYLMNDGDLDTGECIYIDPVLREVQIEDSRPEPERAPDPEWESEESSDEFA